MTKRPYMLYNTNMNSIKSLLIFILFISAFSYCQDGGFEIQYGENEKHSKNKMSQIMMAKIVDELGHKYYWATDSLLNAELEEEYHSRNLPRLLLNVVYQMSESLSSFNSDQKKENSFSIEEMSFEDLRENTLLNLKEARNKLIKNTKTSSSFNMNSFIIPASIADSYCDQIILYREYIGRSFGQKSNSKVKAVPASKLFERELGGDGLTTEQWIELSRYGPQRAFYFENVRNQRKRNTKYLLKLRRQEKPEIEVGNPEPVKLSSNQVEGLTYTYFRNPPEQLSFLYSHDEELIKGIVNWITYINSGNPTKLNKIFKMGLGLTLTIDKKKQGQLSFDNVNYRDVIDKEGNQVRLEYSSEYFDGTNFLDIIINEVHINKNNQIEFITQWVKKDHTRRNSQTSVMLLKNIEGSLLKRIKVVIGQIRSNENSYNGDNLNLRKY